MFRVIITETKKLKPKWKHLRLREKIIIVVLLLSAFYISVINQIVVPIFAFDIFGIKTFLSKLFD